MHLGKLLTDKRLNDLEGIACEYVAEFGEGAFESEDGCPSPEEVLMMIKEIRRYRKLTLS